MDGCALPRDVGLIDVTDLPLVYLKAADDAMIDESLEWLVRMWENGTGRRWNQGGRPEG